MPSRIKVAIVGSVGLPANYGGFETMVYYLTKEQNPNIEYTVYCEAAKKRNRLSSFHNAKLVYLPFKANGVQSIPYDIVSLFLSWKRFDIIIILGTPGCFILPFLNLFGKSKTVVNFGGLEWRRDKWGKLGKAYLKWTEKIALNNCSVIVADNQFFCDYIKKTYNKKSVLIEYGGDHTTNRECSREILDKYPYLNMEYDVSVSRAQEDNNLHLILEAYKQTPNRRLVLISNYNKFSYGRLLKDTYQDVPNIIMQDAVYDLEELDTIRSNANLYIHSHSFCGTAPSLVEAMNLALPIVAFDVPANRFTTESKALYFKDVEDLKRVLNSLNEKQIVSNSEQMKEIAIRRYSWAAIREKYSKLLG